MRCSARFVLLSAALVFFSTQVISQNRGGIPGSNEPAGISGTVLYRADNKPAQHVQVVV